MRLPSSRGAEFLRLSLRPCSLRRGRCEGFPIRDSVQKLSKIKRDIFSYSSNFTTKPDRVNESPEVILGEQTNLIYYRVCLANRKRPGILLGLLISRAD